MVRSDKPICCHPTPKKICRPTPPNFCHSTCHILCHQKSFLQHHPKLFLPTPPPKNILPFPPKIFCNTTSQNVCIPTIITNQHTGVVTFFALLLSIHQLSSFLQNKNFKQPLNILSSLQCTAINSFRQAVSLPLTQ